VEEIHGALAQKVGLRHPMVERGEHLVPPPHGRLRSTNTWVERNGAASTTGQGAVQGLNIGAGHYGMRYGSI
jgi:hypothetical protein